MSRYKTEIEKSLVRIEYALEKLQPNAALSAEALQGIEKQLNAALPRRKRNKLLPSHRSTASAINRLILVWPIQWATKVENLTIWKAVVIAAKEGNGGMC